MDLHPFDSDKSSVYPLFTNMFSYTPRCGPKILNSIVISTPSP